MKVDRVSFNKKEVSNLSFKDFSESFEHLLDSTPVEVAYKLITGNNPPSKKKYVRTDKDSSREQLED